MVNETSTIEHSKVFLAALERERNGYDARIANAKAGRAERLTLKELQDRLGQTQAEIKRVKGLISKAEKTGATSEDEEPVEEPAAA